jgi:hypothetical protein
MTKAEQKRIKDATSSVLSNLKRKLVDFKEFYLNDHAEWSIGRIENRLEAIKESSRTHIDGWEKEKLVQSMETRLSRKNVLLLQFLNEADDSYNKKLDAITAKLVKFGFDHRRLNIERVTMEAAHEFSFLISNESTEVHARVIYAHGAVNVPHFRFITTKRNK